MGLGSSAMTSPHAIVWPLLHTRGPQTCTHTSVVGSSHDPTPAFRAATENKMPETPSSLWGASFGTAGSGGLSTLLERAREIDWLSKEGANLRALGRADDPTTVAKKIIGFHRTRRVWANQTVNGFTEKDVGLGSSATTGSPIVWALLHTRGPQTRTHTSVPRQN